jgi:hypothetical protein
MRFSSSLLVTAFAAFAAGCSAEAAPEAAASSELGSARAPQALSGDYRFAGEVKPVGRLTVDVIDTRMPDANDRLDAARAEGAACWLVVSNTWRCTKMHKAEAVPQSSLDAIALRGGDLFASFGAMTGSPSLVSEGESLVEWQIPQNGSSPLGAFETYRYLELQDGLVKIIVPGAPGASAPSMELLRRDADHLGKWESKVVTESRWRWHEDMAIVVLAR